MSFQLSPGVSFTETDATGVVPAVATSIGAFVGDFPWGPVNQIQLISTEPQLASTFGTPTIGNNQSYWTAASFLLYGNTLKCVRALGKSGSTTHLNATSGYLGNTGVLIKNSDDYANNFSTGQGTVGMWGAKYPGTLGNALKVSVCPASSTAFTGWTYASNFPTAPGTSTDATSVGSTNDELHVVVADATGLISGTPGTVLEKFGYLSQASDAKNADGSSNYYKDVLNNQSQWVWWLDHDAAFTNAGATLAATAAFTTGSAAITYTLSGGTDLAVAVSEVVSALQSLFADAETEDVNLIFAGADASGVTTLGTTLQSLVEGRKDCVATISPPLANTVGNSDPSTNVLTYLNAIPSSSYVVMDTTAVKMYDKYNDSYIWVPACGHVAGLMANTDDVADPWFSPAGYNRGILRGVVKLAFNPTKAQRDSLYQARGNPIVSFPGVGPMLYGDKTALAKPSAFAHINVRRLFIVLEKAIATAAKFQLFEINDEFTQANFRNMVEPFLRDVKGRRGIRNFSVICDSTVNTDQVVASNQFKARILVDPAEVINTIALEFVATRTGVDFSEVAG